MYDATKDRTIEQTDFVSDEGTEGIEISVKSYDGGAEKIQLTRWKTDKGVRKYSKLGRMTIAEAAVIADKIAEIATRHLVPAWNAGV